MLQGASVFIIGAALALIIGVAVHCGSWAGLLNPKRWQVPFRQGEPCYYVSYCVLGLWFLCCWQWQMPVHYYLLGAVSTYLTMWDWLRLQVPVDGLVVLSVISLLDLYLAQTSVPWLALLLPVGFILLTCVICKQKRLDIEVPWGDVWALACYGIWITNISSFLLVAGVVALLSLSIRKQSVQIPFIPSICVATVIDIIIQKHYFL